MESKGQKVMEEAKNIDVRDISKENMAKYVKGAVELSPEELSDVVMGNPDLYQELKDTAEKGLDIFKDMNGSEDETTRRIIDLINKAADFNEEDDKVLSDFELKTQSEITKIINNPDMPEEEKMAYTEQLLKYYQMVKDTHNESKDRREKVVQTAVKEENKQQDRHRRNIASICLFGFSLLSGALGIKVLSAK